MVLNFQSKRIRRQDMWTHLPDHPSCYVLDLVGWGCSCLRQEEAGSTPVATYRCHCLNDVVMALEFEESVDPQSHEAGTSRWVGNLASVSEGL